MRWDRLLVRLQPPPWEMPLVWEAGRTGDHFGCYSLFAGGLDLAVVWTRELMATVGAQTGIVKLSASSVMIVNFLRFW
ncbi:protein of unknown function [Rhodovastum atsumiense]|nr:protein of unknown function [Rhodovastum atsumiense]